MGISPDPQRQRHLVKSSLGYKGGEDGERAKGEGEGIEEGVKLQEQKAKMVREGVERRGEEDWRSRLEKGKRERGE